LALPSVCQLQQFTGKADIWRKRLQLFRVAQWKKMSVLRRPA